MVKISRESYQTLINVAGNPVNAAFTFQTRGATAIGTEVVLGDQGGAALTQLHSTTGVALKFDSSSVQDKTAGTGMLTTRLWGFDINDTLMYEDIICNGQDAVTTSNSDWKTVFYLEPLTYGSGKAVAGNCIITNIAVSATYLGISAAGFQSSICNFYIPKNAIGFFEMDVWFTNDTTAYDAVTVNQYLGDGATQEVLQPVKTIALTSGIADLDTKGGKLSGIMKPGHNIFKGLDIGTTAQTLNFSITWGFRYV